MKDKIVLVLTPSEAQALEEKLTLLDVGSGTHLYAAYRRARRKLREGRKAYEIEKNRNAS